MGRLLSRVTRGRTQSQIQYVATVPPGRAGGLVGEVYRQVERDFGLLAPPMSLHAPAPTVLGAAWLMLRETLVATGQVPRAVKEAVAVAVSRSNACPYCVDVHQLALSSLTGGGAADWSPTAAPRLWAWAGECALDQPAPALPGPVRHAPELIGTAVTFHYLNRMVNIFLVDSPVPAQASPSVRKVVEQLVPRVLRPLLRRPVAAGGSDQLLPAAELPEDLAWAAETPTVASAFARAAAAIDAAGAGALPASVCQLVRDELAEWDGRPLGLGDWARSRLLPLPPEQRPIGRLALLTALASYQVSEADIAAAREQGYGDRRLLEATAWASMAAARRIGAWWWSAQQAA